MAGSWVSLKDCQKEKDALEIFKKDLGTFVRFYEFMSQILDYDDTNLEKLCLYARNLRPMLREAIVEEDDIDLNNVMLSDFSKAIDDAILDSNEAQQNQMMQLLADPKKSAAFAKIVFDLLLMGKGNGPII